MTCKASLEEMNDKKEPVTPRPGETFCRGDSMCKGPEEATGWVSMRLGRVKTRIGGESGGLRLKW